VQGAYIVAGLSFILALAGLSKHDTARAGNRFGIIGMAIALVATIWPPPAGSGRRRRGIHRRHRGLGLARARH
jgi:NAD(P) transhydrogenase subunit beta